jgi:PHD/YefM family antitoxin component YafN of YafNO toxin-antitoxin module
MMVSLTYAKKKLSELIETVENGQAVTICRGRIPVVGSRTREAKVIRKTAIWNA